MLFIEGIGHLLYIQVIQLGNYPPLQVTVQDCDGGFQFASVCDKYVAVTNICLDLEEGKDFRLEKVQRLQGSDGMPLFLKKLLVSRRLLELLCLF